MNEKIICLPILFALFVFTPVAKAESNESKELIVVAGMPKRSSLTPFPNDTRTRKIFERRRFIEEGNDLGEQGLYDEEVMKYQEAMKPELLLYDYDVNEPTLLIAKVLKLQGKYEEALNQIKHLKECPKPPPNQLESPSCYDKLELNALIRARDAASSKPIYEHIRYLVEKYKDILPPKMCIGWCDSIFSTIARLYDHIGDYNGGITFIDEILASPKLSERAKKEYSNVRRAFEEDKKQGTKGRATKALIQSDYFPW